jgi:hypothetical protein
MSLVIQSLRKLWISSRMTMLPQPPPNAPAPPISEVTRRSRKWRNWIWGVGILSVVFFVLAGFVMPLIIRVNKKASLSEAISNGRSFSLALFEFEATYGRFPDPSTIAKVNADHPGHGLKLGSHSSNDFFRQLIAADICPSEIPFYANTTNSRKPDNVVRGSMALEKGECAFSYVAGLSSTDPADTPIAMVPLLPGKRLFDYKSCKKYFGGKAVIVHLDCSVRSIHVDKTGHAYIDGKDLFDPSQPFWGGKVPDVKWPE